jgi:hypothetical protein
VNRGGEGLTFALTAFPLPYPTRRKITAEACGVRRGWDTKSCPGPQVPDQRRVGLEGGRGV